MDSTQSAAGNRFAAPVARVEDVQGDDAFELAGRGARLGAAIIDGVLAGLAFGLLAWLTPLNLFRPDPSRGLIATMVTGALVGFVVFVVLQTYTLADNGQTVGKRLLGIRIAHPDGSKPSLARLLGLRYGITMLIAPIPVVIQVYSLIDSLMIFQRSRRCLHDVIAGTIVIKA